MRTNPRPSARVITAFGGGNNGPRPLSGGQEGAWRADGIVLKPLDMCVDALEWQANALRGIQADGFRVAPPLLARTGDLVCEGWTAWPYLEGRHEARRWADVIAVGERFNAAMAGLARPAFLDRLTDQWSLGDRAAWEGAGSHGGHINVKHVAALTSHLRPITQRSQLIHGDLTGNVLFHPTLPPAVIDLAPYWRPVAFASAIVVADALVWEGADESLLHAVSDVLDFGQYLARALIYRLVTEHLAHPDSATMSASHDPYAATVQLAIRLISS